jgi:hypothetical protein
MNKTFNLNYDFQTRVRGILKDILEDQDLNMDMARMLISRLTDQFGFLLQMQAHPDYKQMLEDYLKNE